MITNVELLQTMYTQAMQYGMKQTETSLANATLKKFAELIVLECTKVCLDPNHWHEDAAGETFSKVIKQHFGVKE